MNKYIYAVFTHNSVSIIQVVVFYSDFKIATLHAHYIDTLNQRINPYLITGVFTLSQPKSINDVCEQMQCSPSVLPLESNTIVVYKSFKREE